MIMPKLVFHGWVEPHQIHQGNHCLFVHWRPRLIGLCSATQNLWRMSWFVITPRSAKSFWKISCHSQRSSQNVFLCVNKGEKNEDEVNAEKFPSHCCTHLFFVCFSGHTETKLLFSWVSVMACPKDGFF